MMRRIKKKEILFAITLLIFSIAFTELTNYLISISDNNFYCGNKTVKSLVIKKERYILKLKPTQNIQITSFKIVNRDKKDTDFLCQATLNFKNSHRLPIHLHPKTKIKYYVQYYPIKINGKKKTLVNVNMAMRQ